MSSVVDAVTGGSSRQTSGAQDYTSGQADETRRQIMELLKPFVSAGAGVLPQLTGMASKGFSADDFKADPGYQFALQQGQQATQNAAGVRGSPFGGQALAAIDQYTQGLANQTYQNSFNRWQTQLGNLQNIAGLGANAGAGVGSNLTGIMSAATGAYTSAANTQTNANANIVNAGIGAGAAILAG